MINLKIIFKLIITKFSTEFSTDNGKFSTDNDEFSTGSLRNNYALAFLVKDLLTESGLHLGKLFGFANYKDM